MSPAPSPTIVRRISRVWSDKRTAFISAGLVTWGDVMTDGMKAIVVGYVINDEGQILQRGIWGQPEAAHYVEAAEVLRAAGIFEEDEAVFVGDPDCHGWVHGEAINEDYGV
jgi:hypothetical protein